MTIVGAGGIGKTRLALAVAASASGEYADGALVGRTGPAHRWRGVVAQAVANALAIQCRAEDGLPSTQAGPARCVSMSALVVLDNCEHLVDDVSQLVDSCARAARRCAVLVTSQES